MKKLTKAIRDEINHIISKKCLLVPEQLVYKYKKCGCMKVLFAGDCIAKIDTCVYDDDEIRNGSYRWSAHIKRVTDEIIDVLDKHQHRSIKVSDGSVTISQTIVSSIATKNFNLKTTNTVYTIRVIVQNNSDKDIKRFGIRDLLLSASGRCALNNITIESCHTDVHAVDHNTDTDLLEMGYIVDPHRSCLKAYETLVLTYSMTVLFDNAAVTSIVSHIELESCGRYINSLDTLLKLNNESCGFRRSCGANCIVITNDKLGKDAIYTLFVNGVDFKLELNSWKTTKAGHYKSVNFSLSPSDKGMITSIFVSDHSGLTYTFDLPYESNRVTKGTITLPINGTLGLDESIFKSIVFCIDQCIAPKVSEVRIMVPKSQLLEGTGAETEIKVSSSGTYPAHVSIDAVEERTDNITTLYNNPCQEQIKGRYVVDMSSLKCGVYTIIVSVSNMCGKHVNSAKIVVYKPLPEITNMRLNPSPGHTHFCPPRATLEITHDSVDLSSCVGQLKVLYGLMDEKREKYIITPNTNNKIQLPEEPGSYIIVAFVRNVLPLPGTFVDGPITSETVKVIKQLMVEISADKTVVTINNEITFKATVEGGDPNVPIQYCWKIDNKTVCTGDSTFVYVPTAVGEYKMKLSVSQNIPCGTLAADSNEITFNVTAPTTFPR